MDDKPTLGARGTAREFVVPAIMLAFVGFYWADAHGISGVAGALPLALTAVLVLAIVAILATHVMAGNESQPNNTSPAISAEVRRWGIVLLPIGVFGVWGAVGAIAALAIYLMAILALLGERRWLWLLGLPAVLSVAAVYLFKSLLYVRLPDGWLLFGG